MATAAVTTQTHTDTVDHSNYLKAGKGWKSWFFTLDHKRIGIMYMIGVMGSFFLAGAFAMVLRTELMTPGQTVMSSDFYNQMFTLHGAIMVFLFIIPSVPAILGNFALPIMLGAKDVAFPKLNLFSFHLWIIGAALFVLSLVTGGLDTGWTFYTPYSVTTSTSVIFAVMGAFILGFSSIFTGMNFLVTVHKMRPPGMTFFRMPLFVWAIYSTAMIQILATPVLGITLLLLAVERSFGLGIFDPALGGDPVLFQHFFWFYSHPAVYIMILPGMGIISELMAVFCRKHIFSYRWIAYSSVAIAMFGFLVWGHHMFTSGQSKLASMVFSALTFSVSIPSAIKVFNWLATMYKGAIILKTPMLYALEFLFLFTIGGLTGVFLGALSVDIHLHDTYFVVAHFHYVMMGGTVFALLGGLYYWWPKIFGRMYNEAVGRFASILVFIGFNATFLPQFVMGAKGMPRRYYDYPPEFASYHLISTLGAYLIGAGLLLVAVNLISAIKRGKPAPVNPWGAATLEWTCSSPPPHHNFDDTPTVGDPYDFSHLIYDPAIEGYVEREPGETGEIRRTTAAASN